MRKYTIYLSSTTYHWWNFRDYNWKKKIIKLINNKVKNIKFIDPLQLKSEDPSVCPLDIKNINKSDFVIIYINKLSIGTLLELGYCIYKHKNFCVFTRSSYVLNHPWIRYLCKNVVVNFKDVLKCVGNNYYKHKSKHFYNHALYRNEKTNKKRGNSKRF